jgi:hypothetical protein
MALGLCLLAAGSTACAGGEERPAPAPGSGLETAQDMTLRHLVDVAQRNKAAELAAATARLAGGPGPSSDPPVAVPARTPGRAPVDGPRLWSLVAAGDRWRAEVLMAGRLHAVDDSSGPQPRIGPWRVLGLAPEGLRVEQVAAGGHARTPLRQLVLPAPARGSSAASYRFASAASPAAGMARSAGLGRSAGDDEDHDHEGVKHGARVESSESGESEGGHVDDRAVRRAAALPRSMTPDVPEAAAHAPAATPARAAAH